MSDTNFEKEAAEITGADLARLGFKHDDKLAARNGTKGRYYFRKAVRVCLNGEEGVHVIAFSEDYGRKGADALGCVVAWEMTFSAATPAAVVFATLSASK